METKPTARAIRAAEIITCGEYGDGKTYKTEYGRKTIYGIAKLIENETTAPDLLEALQGLMDEVWHSHGRMNVKKDFHLMIHLVDAKPAIAKATQVQP